MKRMKKILAVLLAAIMVMSMGTSVFADDDTYTLTVTGNTGHTITAYQLFKGSVLVTGEATKTYTLGDIDWGDNINSSSLLNALVSANTSDDSGLKDAFSGITTESSAGDVAGKIASLNDTQLQALAALIKTTDNVLTGTAISVAETQTAGTYQATGLAGGYYLVYDEASSSKGDSAASYILQVVANVSVTAKNQGAPTITKEITGSNLIGDDGDSNTASYGDTVKYKITISVPGNLSAYDEYVLTVFDKLDSVFTFNNDVTVKVGDSTIDASSYAVVTSNNATSYSEDVDLGENSFAVYFSNIKSLTTSGEPVELSGDSTIVIEYSATISSTGADADTGVSAANENDVYATYSNDPKSNGTGTTTTDKTYTYFASLAVSKTDGTNGLSGASFTLYKQVASSGYTYDSEDDTTYYYYDSTTKTMVELTNDNATSHSSDAYYIVAGAQTEAKESSGSYVANFAGLSAGTYKLIETVTPNGYNTADPVDFTLTATDNSEPGDGSSVSWTSSNSSITVSNASLSTEVVNNTGTVIPSTGGIGTTIFYIVGAVLVLGAGVVLITRRRMASR